jgi:Holliday junction resolvase
MGKASRTKGASFERAIAAELEALTGVRFLRNLEQVRTAAHGDLIADDDGWPFSIECKRIANGASCLTAWKEQAANAARLANKLPAVVFKFDRLPVRVAVPLSAICGDGAPAEWAEISLDGLAYIAREIMAEQHV